ncbi:MAG: serine/threonine-protein phosphatase, partial [Polyangiaceae bacterium]|nr:serine/threonine-protein phosphatase [Polyangiaceae bacterium]
MTGQAAFVTVFGQTDVGKVRTNNEDAFVVSDLTASAPIHAMTSSATFEVRDRGILVAVSDGMGGAAAGEVASALVLDALRLGLSTANASSVEGALRANVGAANKRVWNTARQTGRDGMGATLTAVLFYAGCAYIAEVGDSRAYVLRGQRLVQLTRDQSYVQSLLDSGALTQEQADTFEHKNLILQAMGLKPDVVVVLNRLALHRHDRFLLCSDGLSGKLKDGEIQGIVRDAATLESACGKLIEVALDRGGE